MSSDVIATAPGLRMRSLPRWAAATQLGIDAPRAPQPPGRPPPLNPTARGWSRSLQKQITRVTAALRDAKVDVYGALCFVEADWPLIGGSFEVNGIHVLWPKLLVTRLTEGAAESHSVDVDGVHARLLATFPVA